MGGNQSRLKGNMLAVLCMMLWSTNFPITDRLLADWHPVLLTPVRSGMGALALVSVVVLMGDWRQLFALRVAHLVGAGGIVLALSNLMFVWGQRYVDPVTAAILLSAMPIISIVMGLAKGQERFTFILTAGIALTMVGGTLASLGLQEGSGGSRDGSLLGALMIAGGVVFYVWYTRTMVAISPAVSSLAKAATSMVMLTLITLIYAELSLLFGIVPAEYDLSLTSLGLLFWLGAVSVGASTVLWFISGRMIGVTITSMHHNMVPFYVMLLMLSLGGSVQVLTIAGAALVIAGAAFAQLPALGVLRNRKAG